MRLRTLPLALSTSITGSFYAYKLGVFSWLIFLLTLSTTLLLQILSNFANDYGDYIKGTDLLDRQGPKRMVSSGEISPSSMKRGILITTTLTLISGVTLLVSSFQVSQLFKGSLLLLIGILSIWAAIKYTVGKSAYGYKGLGDIFVFIFFGLVGVGGAFFVQTHYINTPIVILSIFIGLLSSGVLNINNIRDYENDKNAKKSTLIVKIGKRNGLTYHIFIIATSITSIFLYTLFYNSCIFELINLLIVPLLIVHSKKLLNAKSPQDYNAQLKFLAVSAFFFSFLFAIGNAICHSFS